MAVGSIKTTTIDQTLTGPTSVSKLILADTGTGELLKELKASIITADPALFTLTVKHYPSFDQYLDTIKQTSSPNQIIKITFPFVLTDNRGLELIATVTSNHQVRLVISALRIQYK